MSTITRGCGRLVLGLVAIAAVSSAAYLPEARLPLVVWLLAVVLSWRSSPGTRS